MNLLAGISDDRLFSTRTIKFSTPTNSQTQTLSQKLRKISNKFLAKTTKTRKPNISKPRYTPIIETPSAKPSDIDPICPFHHPAGTKNDSLNNSTIKPVVPANLLSTTLLVVIALIFAGPPIRMKPKSKPTITSRGGSNQSTSQSSIDAYLAQLKREEINKILEMVEGCLDYLQNKYHARGVGNSSGRPHSTHSSSSGSSAGTSQNAAGQKRSLDDRDSVDDDLDPGRDGNDQDKRAGKKPKTTPTPVTKLACPFFKHDPLKYGDRQACTGPGWTSISRLKEHIYRAHRQPDHKCNRCCEVFPSGDQLEDHQRAEVPCMVSQDVSIDGINDSQYFTLRKKPAGKKDDVERWEEVYRIIFPKETTIPSPYYDYEDSNRITTVSYDRMKALEEELIHGVRNDLEDQFDQFAAEQRRCVLKMIKDRFKQIIEQWTDRDKDVEPCALPLELPPATSVYDDQPFGDIDIETFFNDSDMNFNYDLLPTETVTGDLLFPSNSSDSAYASMGSPGSPSKMEAYCQGCSREGND